MSDSSTYDNMGRHYDTSRILTADFSLDEQAYKEYSPLFIRYVIPYHITAACPCQH